MDRDRALELVDKLNGLVPGYLARFRERFGYEPGEHRVEPACQNEDSSSLVVAQLSLPDFGNGYFVGPPSWIVKVHQSHEPLWVVLDGSRIEVMVVGS